MFSALMTPTVAKIVNGTAKIPSDQCIAGQRHGAKVRQDDTGAKYHREAGHGLRNESNQRRQLDEVIGNTNADQKHAAQKKA